MCVAGTKSCFGNTVETCSAEGDRRTIEYCAAGLLCNQFTLTCTARTICTPNQPLCNGAVATTCNADGTAYAADSTDCAAVGQVCYQGACLACWPTAYFCSGAEVRHCAADGKSSTLTTTCASGQYCDTAAGIGACKPQICTPNQAVCDGNTATTCKADGSGFATGGTKCTDAGKLCYQGACASLACSPGAYFCSGSTRRHCADDGMISTESASCTGSVYCDSASGTCKGIVCTPGQAVCDGTVVKTCNADGSGYTTSDCVGMGQLCGGGQCVPPTMGGSSTFCAGSRVIRCTSTGDCWSYATCTSLEYCDSTTATCQPLLCVPNHPTCNADNTPVVCYTDGKGYANDGTSCGSRLCVSGTCRDVLFADDFEDADLTGWQATAGTVWSISTSYAAAGTLYSLRGGNGGMYRTFAGLVPSRVGWWLMAPSATFESGRFVLTSTAGQEHPIATSYFTKDGTLALVRDTESVAIPYAANLWYHIELRNIDWTAKTFDYYVNDTLVRAAAAFQDKEATSIGRLDLSNPGVVTAYWDEIELD